MPTVTMTFDLTHDEVAALEFYCAKMQITAQYQVQQCVRLMIGPLLTEHQRALQAGIASLDEADRAMLQALIAKAQLAALDQAKAPTAEPVAEVPAEVPA